MISYSNVDLVRPGPEPPGNLVVPSLKPILDHELTDNVSYRSKILLLKIFDESKFLRRSLLEKLKIEKLLLLDIAARLQGYQGVVQKIHQLLLDTGSPI